MVLTSMHKYVPKIWIIHCSSAKNYSELFSYPATSFVFKETEFIAVTAYQVCSLVKFKSKIQKRNVGLTLFSDIHF